MENKAKKIYVLTLSGVFPKSHSKAGQNTFFKEGLLNALNGDTNKYEYQHYKIHTIRQNYSFWEKRVKEINEGKAVLSVRQWSGAPYRSKQVEIANLTKIGIQKIIRFSNSTIDIENKLSVNELIGYSYVAKNDHLSTKDFKEWFKDRFSIYHPFAIIHFTEFRY